MKQYLLLSLLALSLCFSSFKGEKTAMITVANSSILLTAMKESPTFQALVLRQAQEIAKEKHNAFLAAYIAEPNSNDGKRFMYAKQILGSRQGDYVFSTLIAVTVADNVFTDLTLDSKVIDDINLQISLKFDELAGVIEGQ